MICNLENINNKIKNEGLELLVVSYGGSCSNTLCDNLEKNGYNCKSKTYREILCHCPHFIKVDIPIIYIYDNPKKAFLSMKNRGKGYWDVNQYKLSNNNKITLSDENLLFLMLRQFHSWTKEKHDNVLIIKSSELFDNSIVDKLETFLNRKIEHFPIQWKKPNISIEELSETKLFLKYKNYIDKVNNFVP
jgi:hypothetical protein